MRYLSAFLPALLLIVACTVQKRLHQPGYHVEWKKQAHRSVDKAVMEQQDAALSETPEDDVTIREIAPIAEAELPEMKVTPPDSIACDTLILQSGVKKAVKVEEVGVDVVRYKKCDNLTGPSFSVKKDDVHRVKFANGTEEEITPKGQKPAAGEKKTASGKRVEGFGIASFVLSLAGLFIAGIPLGFISVIFGFISISRIMKHKEFSGGGFAVAGIIIGLLDIILVLVLVGVVFI